MSNIVVVYTDGACRGNPGPGGWGAILNYNGIEKELLGAEKHTTNNRMELMAVIKALEILKQSCSVKLYSDSSYVLKGITDWMPNWKKRDWKTVSKTAVKNEDLWRRLDGLITDHYIEWLWIKGHSGNVGNERADLLANKGIDSLLFL